MTTSINSVNAGANAAVETTVKKSTLSESTKKELEALGISASDDLTEAEAQQKILETKQEQQSDSGQGNLNESEILSEAKILAANVGVSVSSDADVEEILNDIAAELEAMLDEAEDDPAILSTVSQYFSQLVSLDEQYDNYQSFQTAYDNDMNMKATNNKIALGL